MADLTTLIRQASATWPPKVEEAIFGTGDPEAVATAVLAYARGHLGRVEDALFYRPGVGVVAGLRLVGGQEVVVKVHRWNVSVERLEAVQAVQAYLASAGLPAPRPLVGPTPLADGIATAEVLLPGGAAEGHDPEVRGSVATGLHAFIAAIAKLVPTPDVGLPATLATDDLWPEPHDVRFDFEATKEGAEWIDELGAEARRRLTGAQGPPVVGHFDWRVENLGFDGSRIVAIYDWDALALASEPIVVGNAAAQYPVDWRKGEEDPLPSLEEMSAFVEDYEMARGEAFSAEERDLVDAANLLLCAYGSRCQHSDLSLHPELSGPTQAWFRLLRERGRRGLIVE